MALLKILNCLSKNFNHVEKKNICNLNACEMPCDGLGCDTGPATTFDLK